MIKKIKQLGGIILIMFSTVLLSIAVLSIWDVVSNEVAREALLKTFYTFGSIFIVSIFVLFISKIIGEKK
jgi:hypothetical protein